MKKILVDARMVGPHPHGIAKFVEGIAAGLSQMAGRGQYEPFFLVSANTPADSPVRKFTTVHAESAFLSPKEWVELPKLFLKSDIDAYHSPSLSALPWITIPYAVTLHDLNHLHYGGGAKKVYYQTVLKRFVRRARVVTTVSEFSREEIAKWIDAPVESIEMTWNSLETPAFDDSVLARHELKPDQFFMCISGLKPHKNLKVLLEGYRQYRFIVKDALPLAATVSGQQPPGVIALESIGHSGAMNSLMRQSRAFFFPSLYEGFGRPPVEAAAVGARLAVSDIPPHREGLKGISESAMIWVEPKSVQQWTAAFQKMHGAARVERVSSDQGRMLLDRYSTKSLAEAMDRVYRRLVE